MAVQSNYQVQPGTLFKIDKNSPLPGTAVDTRDAHHVVAQHELTDSTLLSPNSPTGTAIRVLGLHPLRLVLFALSLAVLLVLALAPLVPPLPSLALCREWGSQQQQQQHQQQQQQATAGRKTSRRTNKYLGMYGEYIRITYVEGRGLTP